jgi:hypothetical protein
MVDQTKIELTTDAAVKAKGIADLINAASPKISAKVAEVEVPEVPPPPPVVQTPNTDVREASGEQLEKLAQLTNRLSAAEVQAATRGSSSSSGFTADQQVKFDSLLARLKAAEVASGCSGGRSPHADRVKVRLYVCLQIYRRSLLSFHMFLF